MKYCRFASPDGPQYGLIENDRITHLLPLANGVPDLKQARSVTPQPLESVSLLAPVQPSKIICVGRNYADHAKELGNEVPKEILIFLKPPSSIVAPQEKIARPKISQRVDFEGELAVIVSKKCRKMGAQENVRQYILGYTCANDVTARDLQKKDDQWTRAKGFDTFCPVGPIITDEIDPQVGVRVQTLVNGEQRQNGNTRDFIFSVDVIIRYISRIMTLFPFDLICTGTPRGVGPMHPKDVVAVKIEGIGTLSNEVRTE